MKAANFGLKSVKIWKVGTESSGDPTYWIYKSGESEGTIINFQYFEYLYEEIGYKATLIVHDRAANIISSMPIQGFEKVTIEVVDYLGKDHEYDFRVWRVSNRVETDRKRIYTLGLVSESYLLNEGIFVNTKLEGTPTDIVRKILKDFLKIPEAKMTLEESINILKFIPASKNPFSVIRDLQAKSIAKAAVEPKTKKATPATGQSNASVVRSDAPTDTQKLKGTAGFFFFETKDGFTFKSIDAIVSADETKFGGSPPVTEYVYKPALIDQTEAEDDRKILNVAFRSEIDIMKKLREGAYSSLCVFFNINTGKYEEYVYNLKDMWDNMAHLGAQTKLPQGQEKLSQYPTRILSTVINNENWYNGTEVASEAGDGGDNTNAITDSQKQYLVQSIARAGILTNQQLSIEITGNLDLRVGNKIIVKIPNQVPNASKEELGSYDPEHSGIYLIKKINHQFDCISLTCRTVLDLIRDSSGYEESNVT